MSAAGWGGEGTRVAETKKREVYLSGEGTRDGEETNETGRETRFSSIQFFSSFSTSVITRVQFRSSELLSVIFQ